MKQYHSSSAPLPGRHNYGVALALTIAFGLFASGCVADATDNRALSVELASRTGQFALTVLPTAPPRVGTNQFDIVFARPAAAKVRTVTAFMPAHGHAAELPQVEAMAADRSRISNLIFFMPGRWEITLELEGAGGMRDSLRFNVFVE
jgi:hypothetical protein